MKLWLMRDGRLWTDALAKGWVRDYLRRGRHVRGYWRDEKLSNKVATWGEIGRPSWGELMKKRALFPASRLTTAGEVEAYLRSMREQLGRDKDGWATIGAVWEHVGPEPHSMHAVPVTIDPGLYGHWVQRYGRTEADRRISYFPAAVATVQEPWEVWRHKTKGPTPRHAWTFVRGFQVPGEADKTIAVVVAIRDHKPAFWTLIPVSDWRQVNKLRVGRLVFEDPSMGDDTI